MKKVLAILFAVSLCISSLYTVAFAEEEKSNEMIPICVSVPEGWDAPCCWAWADDGTNAFEAWPGEQLEPLDDGWYYTYVPRFVQNIIVNASEASVQTEGIAVEAGKAVWITVADDATASVSYEAQSIFI